MADWFGFAAGRTVKALMARGCSAGRFPRLAVIGCGAIAEDGYLPALDRLGWRPHVLIDPRTERAERLAERWRATRVAEDVSRLVSGEVEAALVTVPPTLHARIALPLIEAGVHALVEKPFTTNAVDAKEMVEAAARTGVCLAVGHTRRFLFVNRWIKAVLDSGALGDVETVDLQDGTDYHSLPRDGEVQDAGSNAPAFWDAGVFGGGVWMDLGPHALDTLLWWFGPVRAADYRDDSMGGVEAEARCDLEFESGVLGTVELSRIRTLRNTVVIIGSRGRIEARLNANGLLRVAPGALRRFKLDGFRGTAMPRQGGGAWGPDGAGERLLADWLRAIRSDQPVSVPVDSGIVATELIERCYAARKPLKMPWRTLGPKSLYVAGAEPEMSGPGGRSGGESAVGRDDSAAGEPAHKSPKAAVTSGLPHGGTVLVTGGTGFIGGRLIETLVVREGARVRAGVRSFRNVARLARFPSRAVELRKYDMVEATCADVDTLVAGCGTVFHLALDRGGVPANVAAVRLLGAACVRHGARLVFTSSLSVYEPLPDRPIDETSPLGELDDSDAANVACQREVLRMVRDDGLAATIIQPTIVYGPFGTNFTDLLIERLIENREVLPAPGNGICNAVYVDDVVRALVLAAVHDGAVGETFLISGAEHPTWYMLYARYARAIGRADRKIRILPREDIARRYSRHQIVRTARRRIDALKRLRARRPVLNLLNSPARLMLRGVRLLASSGERRRWDAVSPRSLDLLASRCEVKIDKASELLGWVPAYDLDRGLDLTMDYVRWAHGRKFLCDPTDSPFREGDSPPFANGFERA